MNDTARNTEAAQLADKIHAAYKASAYSNDHAIARFDLPIYSSLQTALRAAIELAYGLDAHWAEQVLDISIDSGESIGYSVWCLFDHLAEEARGHAAHLMEYAYEAREIAAEVDYARSPRTRTPFAIYLLDAEGRRPRNPEALPQLAGWDVIAKDRAAKRAELVAWYTDRGYLVPEADPIYF